MVSPRWAWATVIAVIIAAAVFIVFRLGNQASAGVALDDPVVWIEDGQRGELLQVNASTREITARIPVGERGDSIKALPRERDAVFLNRSTGELGVVGSVSLRVDFVDAVESTTGPLAGEQLELEADFTESANVFVVDPDEILVMEPGAGIRLPIPTPEGIGSTAVREDGRLLAVTIDGRQVGITSDRGIEPFAKLEDPVENSDVVPQLVRADDSIYVVDVARRTVNELTERGERGTTTCLSGSLSNVLLAGSVSSDPDTTPRVVAHDPEAGVLSVSETARSECFTIDIDVPGELYGEPVVVDGSAYLPNWETGRIVIVDLVDRAVISTVPFSSIAGRPFELEVFNNTVWANEPQGPFAAVVSRQGIEPIRKLGRVVVDSGNSEEGTDGGVVLGGANEDAGRVFGDSGDPVDDQGPRGDGQEGDSGVGSGSSDQSGTEPLADTGLDPDTNEPPVGVIFPDVESESVIAAGLQANFTFSADTVSVGEEVTFTDDSIGEPISWNWDFGDGTGGVGPEVVKSWDSEGVFTVQLFVSDGAGNEAQQAKDITVVADDVLRVPDALFSFRSSTVEVDEALEFVSQSTGEPDLLEWDFGDGVEATGQVVEHRFAQAGTFDVTLTATNAAGNDSVSVPITVVEGVGEPEAIISAFPTVLEVGQSVLIRSESTNSPTSIVWDFGDGTAGSGGEVRHSWDEPGTFRVRLTVENSAGSSSTFRDVVIKPRVDPPIARFGESSLEAIVGETINFNDLSQNNPTRTSWEFGDGATATGPNVSHSWTEAGTYTVTLNVVNDAGSDEVAKTVTILPLPPDPPKASFTVPSATVPVNAVINFTDTSTNDPTEWLWTFGDGSRSRAQSPPHAFQEPGTYEVTLRAGNAGGNDSTTQTIVVSNPPVASFNAVPSELQVDFTDTSTNNPTEWLWTFGDGTTSTAKSPSKEYSNPGTYTVSLVATNQTGSSSPATRSITIARRPRAAFEATIAGLTVTFDGALSTGAPTQWLWDLGDGTTSNVPAPSHTYDSPGRYTVELTVTNAAGESSSESEIRVEFAPPVAAFTCEAVADSLVCDGSASTGAVEYRWRSVQKTESETGVDTNRATFTYDSSGRKEIVLVVTNQADDDDRTTARFDLVVPERPEVTEIVIVSNVGGVVRVRGEADHSPTSWAWSSKEAVSVTGETTATPTFTFDKARRVEIVAVAINAVGPSKEESRRVVVNLLAPPVVSEVTVTSNDAGTVRLRGVASNDPDRWFWNVPNGEIVSGASTATPTFEFSQNGSSDGTVRAENDDGRSEVFRFTIAVSGIPTPPVVTSVNLLSNSNGVVELEGIASNQPTSWTWAIEDGSVTAGANSANPTFVFDRNGTFNGSVSARNGDGKSPLRTFTVTINDLIDPPVAAFDAEPLNGASRFRMVNRSQGGDGATYEWTVNPDWVIARNGRNIALQFPGPGTYAVTLTVTNAGGVDSITKQIESD